MFAVRKTYQYGYRWLAWVGVTSGCLIMPASAQAAVIINEIAWMGDSESSYNEWIELYNNGDVVESLSDWTLSDSGTLEIILTGTLAAGEYGVLERTDDDSAPGTAFMIYTGNLSNGGTTLSLRRPDGTLVDRVAGGENWEAIGGSNETKETAQYTGSRWITAEPTPGAKNHESAAEVSEGSKTGVPARWLTGTPAQKTKLVLPDVTLTLQVEGSAIAFVGQPFPLTVDASGLGEHLLDSLVYNWNFGDGHTGVGNEVVHTYRYPGTYIVYVEGSYARHRELGRFEVTVLPVQLAVARINDKTVQILNNSKYEVDISHFRLRGVTEKIFPDHTLLVAGGAVTLPFDMTQPVLLFDTEGTLVASEAERVPYSLPQVQITKDANKVLSATIQKPVVSSVSDSVESIGVPTDRFGFVSSETATDQVKADPKELATVTQAAVVSEATAAPGSNRLAYVGLIGLLGVAITSVVMTRRV